MVTVAVAARRPRQMVIGIAIAVTTAISKLEVMEDDRVRGCRRVGGAGIGIVDHIAVWIDIFDRCGDGTIGVDRHGADFDWQALPPSHAT